MRDLIDQGAKCVILTSGTLSPLDSFTTELQVIYLIKLMIFQVKLVSY